MMKTEKILGMNVNPLTYDSALAQIKHWIELKQTKFISISSVNNVVSALKDPALMDIQNQADMVTTDGMPLVWVLHSRGFKDCSRVYGPTLMLRTLKMAEENNYLIYLYGSTNDVLADLIAHLYQKFPKLNIVGSYSPPFRLLSEEENQKVVDKINGSRAQLVFVGLSTPKQEQWMYRNRDKLKGCVMLGVGAAFLFHAGKVRQAPALLQKMGLEWFFRLMMEPKRLWRRYLFGNGYFLWKLLLSKL